jgi:hypothetical protein
VKVKSLVFLGGLLIAAVVATYVRYQSLDPCDWMMRDLAESSNLPDIVVAARVRSAFLLDGITEPTATDCLSGWWRLRSEMLPEKP